MPSSNLGYAFPRNNGLISKIVSTTTQVAALPWHIVLSWVSWVSGFIILTLNSLGIPPRDFIPASKLRELHSIVDHMHTREDLYRRAIRELQDEIDTKEGDRKKALRKLKATKDEISQLSLQLTELHHNFEAQQDYYQLSNDPSGSFKGTSTHQHAIIVHLTFAIMTSSLWWFCQADHAALQWKLVFSMYFPVCPLILHFCLID